MFGLGIGMGIGFGSKASAFSPKSIGGANLWLRADSGVTLVGASTVSGWADQSGVGDSNRNASQASAANRPVLNAIDAGYNGQATISFVASNTQFLRTGVWSVAPSQPYSVFIVGQDSGTNQYFCDDQANLNTAVLGVLFGAYCLRNGVVSAGVSNSANTPVVFGGEVNGVNSKVYISAKTAGATALTPGAGVPVGLTIGCGADGTTNPLNGKIAEIVVYSGILSDVDRGKLFDYFGTRYGISIGA